MKKLRFIFVFIFLAGMVFTVIQYLPLLEEETHGHRVEMKKDKRPDASGSDDNDCDDDDNDDERSDLYEHLSFGYVRNMGSEHFFYFRQNRYHHPAPTINTPPPKV